MTEAEPELITDKVRDVSRGQDQSRFWKEQSLARF